MTGMTLPPIEKARLRLAFLGACLLMGFAAISVRAGAKAGLGLPVAHAAPMLEETRPLIHRREILDREGEILASSVRSKELAVKREEISDPGSLVTRLTQLFPDLDAIDALSRLTVGKGTVYLRRHLTPRQQASILDAGIPGVEFHDSERRIYPRLNLTSHIVGFTNVDQVGEAGVELRYNQRLNEHWSPLTLTIDSRVQAIVHEALSEAMTRFRALGAVGVIMDADTGEVLAAVSLPDYNPHIPAERKQTFNRVIQGSYEMGSTFKTFAIALAFELGVVTPTDLIDVGSVVIADRRPIRDDHAIGHPITVAEVFTQSSNKGTVLIQRRYGIAKLRDFLKELGMFDPIDVGLQSSGIPRWARDPYKYLSERVAFGYTIQVTPMHLVAATAAMVNGGIYRTPTFIRGEQGLHPRVEKRVISAETSDMIRRLMWMNAEKGTGKRAAADGYLVGGKTGTAQKYNPVLRDYDDTKRFASFAGVFPAHDPHFVIYVMVEEPQPDLTLSHRATGGIVAAPVVSQIVTRMAPLYGIKPFDAAALAVGGAGWDPAWLTRNRNQAAAPRARTP